MLSGIETGLDKRNGVPLSEPTPEEPLPMEDTRSSTGAPKNERSESVDELVRLTGLLGLRGVLVAVSEALGDNSP